jgi:2-polyprenyl-3-methyl-5-hydroxy-6-metoxy-1,4-benzoquinol methylase
MINWLKEDMLARNEIRLFIADFSAADFLAHAYGSRSEKYIHALQKIDKQIGDFIDWMRTTGMSVNTAVIVCSDHGIAAIDHSYLIADSERYVPFLICGDGIKKGFQIKRPGKIMDICCTVSYLLGIPYTRQSRGQVFSEALEDSNLELEQEELVTRFNQLKYDVEAKRYQSGHPEIYEGDVAWWDNYITQFAMRQTNQSRVLDIGCGSGFIAERFIAMGADTKEFICVDSSESMLQEAKKGLMQYPNFSFISNLNEVEGDFNLITLNSFFHHVAHPKKIAEIIDQRLAKGGIVIGSHEPNKRVFQNKLFYAAASFYKNMGGDVSIDQETVDEFNVLLSKRYPNAPKVCREEILQMVEYHSPLEQYEKGIAAEIGFVPEEFCQTYFPGYEVLILQTYSTFSHRPWLSRHKEIQSLFSAMFSLIFKEGNLFRFVLKKPQH